MKQRSHFDSGAQSRVEFGDDVSTWSDYRTAHYGVGDPGYKTLFQATCNTCRQQVASAEEAGVTVTSPDEEWTLDGG